MRLIAPAAYLGSLLQVLHDVQQYVGHEVLGPAAPPTSATAACAAAERAFNTTLEALGSEPLEAICWQAASSEPQPKQQKALTTLLHSAAESSWRSRVPDVDKARLTDCSTWGSGIVFRVIPNEAAFTIPDLAARLLLRLRLGLPVVGLARWCDRCTAPLDQLGNHSHACPGNPGIRHNRIRDLLHRLLSAAGFNAHKEQEEPLLRHRPDIRVDAGLAPVLTYLEVHVSHPTAPSANHVANALTPEAAAENAWEDKLRQDYAPLPERPHFRLLPALFTTYGSWHPGTRRFLQECARRVVEAAGPQPNAAGMRQALFNRWASSLAVAIHL